MPPPRTQAPGAQASLQRPAADPAPRPPAESASSSSAWAPTRPTVRGVPALRGDVGAQALDARVTQCGLALARLGLPGFWKPECRDLVMQLPVGSGAAVLDVFAGRVPLVAAGPEAERTAHLHAMLHSLV